MPSRCWGRPPMGGIGPSVLLRQRLSPTWLGMHGFLNTLALCLESCLFGAVLGSQPMVAPLLPNSAWIFAVLGLRRSWTPWRFVAQVRLCGAVFGGGGRRCVRGVRRRRAPSLMPRHITAGGGGRPRLVGGGRGVPSSGKREAAPHQRPRRRGRLEPVRGIHHVAAQATNQQEYDVLVAHAYSDSALHGPPASWGQFGAMRPTGAVAVGPGRGACAPPPGAAAACAGASQSRRVGTVWCVWGCFSATWTTWRTPWR